jgi:endonuclease/exonuclease/phosphatase family metal-dependent hydrolase
VSSSDKSIFRRLFSSTVFLLNILAIVWLGFCIAASYTDPLKVKNIAIFSLTTPFAVAVNLGFVILWFFSTHKLRALLSLSILLIGYKTTSTVFAFNFFDKNDMVRRPRTIKILSWNSHGMGVFNKPISKAFDQKILDFLHEQDADILCLPEYSLTIDNILKPYAEKIIKSNGYIDYRFQADNSLNDRIYLGTAVFSKYPFKNYQTHQLSRYIYMMQGDVQLPYDKTVRVFFVHLTTFGLSDKEKDYIDEVKHNTDSVKGAMKSANLFVKKLNTAYENRAGEVNKAIAIIKKSPYPVILCGDFNDLPGSYTYTTMRGNLSDAFLDKGKGFGRSYNRLFPTIRIDHFFYSDSVLRLIGFECPSTELSDHNPIITNFEIVGARP